jgi:MFS family permease
MSTGPAEKPLLMQRSFAALWWGQLISILGDRLTYLALGGLLLEHTHRGADPRYPLLLAVLGNVMVAPVLLFAPFTGAWVDRMNLKRALIVSDLLRAFVVLAIPWLYTLTGHTGSALALVFVLFTCNVFFLPAKSAITPEIVPVGQLLAANSLLTIAGIAATSVGALMGGWVVDHWGWKFAMRVDAVTYAVSVGTLMAVNYRHSEHHASLPELSVGGYLREVGEGWRVVTKSARVRLALLALGAVWVGGGFLHVAGNQHIQRAASIPGMERVGVLLSALGIGGGISTWWVNTHGRDVPRSRLLGTGFLLSALALTAFAVSRRFAVFAISSFFVGLFISPAFVLSETLLQEGAEPGQRARVFSARDFLMRLAFLGAVTLAAWLAQRFGTSATILTCASVIAIVGVTSLLWKFEPASSGAG